MGKFFISFRVFFIFALFLGVIYPLGIMILGQTIFPYQANGSLLIRDSKVIGSSLIAQAFSSPKYFHSRFSGVNYDATNSGASDLAISNGALYQQVHHHIKYVQTENHLDHKTHLPPDMVLDSASGLDPHISLANAMLQLPRVAQFRNLPSAKVKHLIYNYIDRDFVGIWGQAGVNVLKLNLALDELEAKQLRSI